MKKRHHYIPRLLLNNFASKTDKKKRWIWQFSKDRPPLEVSTRDVAVATYFYGRDDKTIEEKFVRIENGAAAAIGRMLTSSSPQVVIEDDLRSFIYLMSVRTRNMRSEISRVANSTFEKILGEDKAPQIEAILEARAEDLYERELRRQVLSVPRRQRNQLRKLAQAPHIKGLRIRELVQQLRETNAVRRLLAEALKAIPDFSPTVEEGQLKGLERLLRDGVSPQFLKNVKWQIISNHDEGFVLGDCVTFAVGSDGRSGSFFRFGQESWREVYFPLTPECFLVGRHEESTSLFTPHEINLNSAKLSIDTFFASGYTAGEADLVQEIGSLAPILSEEECERLVKKIYREKLQSAVAKNAP